MIPVRRKLSDGRILEGEGLGVYIPRRGRNGRHWQDVFSCALALAKQLPDQGQQLAWDQGRELAKLVPVEFDLLACPPASRKRLAAGFYFARELTVAVCDAITDERACHVSRPLQWAQETIEGAGKASHIQTQAGQGRKLARVAECLEDLTGRRAVVVDDLFTTGITAALTAEALYRAGAEEVRVVVLGVTERTEKRPADEQERLLLKREQSKLRRSATG